MGQSESNMNNYGFNEMELKQLKESRLKLSNQSGPLLKGLQNASSFPDYLIQCKNILLGNSFDKYQYIQTIKITIQELIHELIQESLPIIYNHPNFTSKTDSFKSLNGYLLVQYSELNDFTTWFSNSKHIQVLWRLYFKRMLLGENVNEIPSQLKSVLDSKGSSQILLNSELLFLIDHELNPIKYKSRAWRLMYNSDIHGKSWSIFQQHLPLAAASVLIIRDSEGHVFGGFCPVPWITCPNFFSNGDTFLFQSYPSLRLYQSTNINKNYCYYNSGFQSFPNGIGFGGQLEYFGIWLKQSFDGGHSRAEPQSTTFGNPQLSGKSDFILDSVELWCIQERDPESPRFAKSILDNSETIALLEMSGKTMYSQQIGRVPQEPE
ncbi:TLD-domain-containing protein [Globomyces pollinis-pini]|nr:TLD-domain-containing protein [Globomyces pollinis-pini]